MPTKKKPDDAVYVEWIVPWPTKLRDGSYTSAQSGEVRVLAHPTDPTRVRWVPAEFVAWGRNHRGDLTFHAEIHIDAEDPDTPEWQIPTLEVEFTDPRGSLSELIRPLDLDEVVRLAVEEASTVHDRPREGLSVGRLRGRRRARSMASQLDEATEAYRAGGVPAVAERLRVSERQARNYVKKARDAGLIDEEEQH